MKIVFICSSLEPGKDGVGDYTRLLAGELVRQGNTVALLSLNDRFVNEVFTGMQPSEGVDVPVKRLPSSFFKKERFTHAKEWIGYHNPEWLSLQFVPFGFHPKGLKVGLGKFLLSVGGDRQWHIMFHELWVGVAVEESKKLIWWGRLQRYLIKSLILKLHPKVIHTQTPLYKALLEKLGFNAEYLPLFGNIPVTGMVNAQNGKDISGINKKLSFVVFGSIHDGAPINEFAKDVASYSLKNNIPATLTFIGRCGAEQDRWSAVWEAEGLKAETLGEQPTERISEILSISTIGISATAFAVIEKSGSVAAMRQHGLPVLCVSKSWHPAGMTNLQAPPGIIEYRIGNFEACLAAIEPMPLTANVSDIAGKFISALSKVS